MNIPPKALEELHAMLSRGYRWVLCLRIVAMKYSLDALELSEAYAALQNSFE
jgi:hypothetical protein